MLIVQTAIRSSMSMDTVLVGDYRFTGIASSSCGHGWQCSVCQAQAKTKLSENIAVEHQKFKVEVWCIYLFKVAACTRNPWFRHNVQAIRQSLSKIQGDNCRK